MLCGYGGRRNMITLKTVNLIAKLLHSLAEAGTLSVPEAHEIVAELRSLARTSKPIPVVIPKLIDQRTVAEMLGLGLSNFKKLESEGAFPFKRKMIGCAVRYRNIDIIDFIRE